MADPPTSPAQAASKGRLSKLPSGLDMSFHSVMTLMHKADVSNSFHFSFVGRLIDCFEFDDAEGIRHCSHIFQLPLDPTHARMITYIHVGQGN